MKRKAKRALLIAGIFVGAAGLSVGLSKMKPPPESKAIADATPLVEVLPLEEMTASFTIASQGTVRPRTETVLSAEVSGSIVSISPKFIAGGVFAKGEVVPDNEFRELREFLDFLHAREVGYERGHTRVLNDVFDVCLLEPGKDRNDDGIGKKHAKYDCHLIDRLLHTNANAIPRPDTQLLYGFRRRKHSIEKFAVCDRLGSRNNYLLGIKPLRGLA